MISDGLNPVKWIEVKESQKVPRLELDERIQGWTVYQDYLNTLGGWNWVWNLVRTHLLKGFYAFLKILARSDELREQFACSKAPREMTEVADTALRIEE